MDPGHSVRFDNKYFKTLAKDGNSVYLRKGTEGLLIRSYSGTLFFSVDENIFALEEIPLHERASKNFDTTVTAEKPKKRYIPPATHPWRLQTFSAFVRKQQQPSA